MPKSWHKQQDTTVSPADKPGGKKPVKIRMVWDEGHPKEHWLPWVFDDDAAAQAFIEDWKTNSTEVTDPPGPVSPSAP